uniref:Uncharacterized protein n=1 Tax=Scytodes thoracica TaxID=1112478 RepID=A0A0A0VA90_SCYTH|nr:hypothetical protein [Scytodes thoracica]
MNEYTFPLVIFLKLIIMPNVLVQSQNDDMPEDPNAPYLTISIFKLQSFILCYALTENRAAQIQQHRIENLLPDVVKDRLRYCQKTVLGETIFEGFDHIKEDPSIPKEVFSCVRKGLRELTYREKRQVVTFEDNARRLAVAACGAKEDDLY